jgi:hypothetical protein
MKRLALALCLLSATAQAKPHNRSKMDQIKINQDRFMRKERAKLFPKGSEARALYDAGTCETPTSWIDRDVNNPRYWFAVCGDACGHEIVTADDWVLAASHKSYDDTWVLVVGESCP